MGNTFLKSVKIGTYYMSKGLQLYGGCGFGLSAEGWEESHCTDKGLGVFSIQIQIKILYLAIGQ